MKISGFLNASYIRIDNPSAKTTESSASKKTETTETLTTSQKALIAELQARDTTVRAHERAHISAGGGVIRSGATFVYQEAPDKKLYAIGGEVSIDTSEESSPQETIQKMQIVRTAALAPSDPSSTDYQVAATASMLQMQARLEVSRAKQAELIASNNPKYASDEDSTPLFSKFT